MVCARARLCPLKQVSYAGMTAETDASGSSRQTDPTLKQPSPGPPPGWVFPVVWTSLYAGMGWAAHVAVRALDTSPRIAVRHAASLSLGLWYGQFALNMAWTPLFFGARRTKTALVDIVALWGTVAALTVGGITRYLDCDIQQLMQGRLRCRTRWQR